MRISCKNIPPMFSFLLFYYVLLVLTISCFQDFYGDEYQAHTSCMSEDQRYSKEGRGGWDPSKGQVSNGETKRTEWTEYYYNFRVIRGRTNKTPGLAT